LLEEFFPLIVVNLIDQLSAVVLLAVAEVLRVIDRADNNVGNIWVVCCLLNGLK
jgi:hypothetical protein